MSKRGRGGADRFRQWGGLLGGGWTRDGRVLLPPISLRAEAEERGKQRLAWCGYGVQEEVERVRRLVGDGRGISLEESPPPPSEEEEERLAVPIFPPSPFLEKSI